MIKDLCNSVRLLHSGDCEKEIEELKQQVASLMSQVQEGKLLYDYQTAALEKEIIDLKEDIDFRKKVDDVLVTKLSKEKDQQLHQMLQFQIGIQSEKDSLKEDIMELEENLEILNSTPSDDVQIEKLLEENRNLKKENAAIIKKHTDWQKKLIAEQLISSLQHIHAPDETAALKEQNRLLHKEIENLRVRHSARKKSKEK